MPSAGDSGVPSASVIFWEALNVAKQYYGRRGNRPGTPAHRPPIEDDEVAGCDAGDPGPDLLDHPGGFVAEEVREVVADAAFPIVQIGVAHAARLHFDYRLTRTGSGTTTVSIETAGTQT